MIDYSVPCAYQHIPRPIAPPRDSARPRRRRVPQNLRKVLDQQQPKPTVALEQQADKVQNDHDPTVTTASPNLLPLHLLQVAVVEDQQRQQQQQQRFLVGIRRSDNNQLLPSLPPSPGKIRDLPRRWGSLGSDLLQSPSPKSNNSPKRHNSEDGELLMLPHGSDQVEDLRCQSPTDNPKSHNGKQRRGLKASRGSMAALRKGLTVANDDGLPQQEVLLETNENRTPRKVSPRGALAALRAGLGGSHKKKSPLAAALSDHVDMDHHHYPAVATTATETLVLHKLDNIEVRLWQSQLEGLEQQSHVITDSPEQLQPTAGHDDTTTSPLDTPSSLATKSTQPLSFSSSCTSSQSDEQESYHTAANQAEPDDDRDFEESFESPCPSWTPVFDDDHFHSVPAANLHDKEVITGCLELLKEEDLKARGIEASMARDIKTTLEDAGTPELSQRMSLMASMAMEVAAAVVFESPCPSWEPVFDDAIIINDFSQSLPGAALHDKQMTTLQSKAEEHKARGIDVTMAKDIKTTLEEAGTPELSQRMSLMASIAMEVAAAVTSSMGGEECRDEVELDDHHQDRHEGEEVIEPNFKSLSFDEEEVSLADSQHTFITEPPSVHPDDVVVVEEDLSDDDMDSQDTFITVPPVLDCSKISGILVTPSTAGTMDALTVNSSLIEGQFLLMDDNDSQHTFITEAPDAEGRNKSLSIMAYSDDPTKESTSTSDEDYDSLLRPMTAKQLANVFDSEFVLQTRSLASDEEEITVIESVVEESEVHEYFDFENLDDHDNGDTYGLIGDGYTDDVSVSSDLTSHTFQSHLQGGANDKDAKHHSLIEGLHLALRHVSPSSHEHLSSPLHSSGLDDHLANLRHVTPNSAKHSRKHTSLRRARTNDGMMMTMRAAVIRLRGAPLKAVSGLHQLEPNMVAPSPSAPQRLRRCRSMQPPKSARTSPANIFDHRIRFFDDGVSIRSELMSHADDASVGVTSVVVLNKCGEAKCVLDFSLDAVTKSRNARDKKARLDPECILDHSWDELDRKVADNRTEGCSIPDSNEEILSLFDSNVTDKPCRPAHETAEVAAAEKPPLAESAAPKLPSLDQQKIRQLDGFYETVSVSFLAPSIKHRVVVEVICEALRILKPGGVLNVLDIRGKIVEHWSEQYPQFDFLKFRKATDKDQEAHETNTLRILEKSGLKARFSRDDPNIVHWTCHKPN